MKTYEIKMNRIGMNITIKLERRKTKTCQKIILNIMIKTNQIPWNEALKRANNTQDK